MQSSTDLRDFAGFPTSERVRNEISDLKSRYFFCLDNKMWAQLKNVFTDDARFEGFAFKGQGGEGFARSCANFMTGIDSVHHGCMPQYRMMSDDLVRVRWSMVDYLTWKPGSREYRGVSGPTLSGFRGYGYYDEEYKRTADGWRIGFMRLTRFRVDMLHGETETPVQELLDPVTTWISQ